MVEYWNIGILGIKSGCFLDFNLRLTRLMEKGLILVILFFHYSIIPSFHGIRFRHSQFALAWP
jgi:hypothetical protein